MTDASTAAFFNHRAPRPADTLVAWQLVAALLKAEQGTEDGDYWQLELAVRDIFVATGRPARVIIALAGIVAQLCRDQVRPDSLRAVHDEILMLTSEIETETA